MTLQTPSCAGFVLAGGKSSRMGVEKAFLSLGGRPLVEQTLDILRKVCVAVAIVGDPAKFNAYGKVVTDVFPGCGPLAGIHAGLKNSSSDLNFFVAVDMPFVSAELIGFLLSSAGHSGATVVVPRTSRGLQPLCAVYRRSFLVAAEDALRAGKYKIDAAFTGLDVREIGEAELAGKGFSERDFFNVNTAEDLREAAKS